MSRIAFGIFNFSFEIYYAPLPEEGGEQGLYLAGKLFAGGRIPVRLELGTVRHHHGDFVVFGVDFFLHRGTPGSRRAYIANERAGRKDPLR